MRKILFLIPLLLLTVGCGTRIGPGYVGIKVNQAGSLRGVQDIPLQTGWVFYNPFTQDVYEYPVFKRTYTWTLDPKEGAPHDESITFSSKEGTTINADVSLTYSFRAEKVPHVFIEFKADADAITQGYMRQQVRDSFVRVASGYQTMELYASKQRFLDEAEKHLTTKLGDRFLIDTLTIVGKMRVAPEVEQSLNAVIRAQQRALEQEAKIREIEAQAKQAVAQAEGQAKAVLTVAEAQAKAQRMLLDSTTPAIIELKKLEKWNGVLPQFAGTTQPLIQVK